MALQKYAFVYGVLGTEFLQLQTTDSIYLKDLLEQEIFPALALYNEQVMSLEKVLCRSFDSADANSKVMFSDNEFQEIGDLEQPGMAQTFASWNRPIPIRRFGSASIFTRENIVQMSSKQITEHYNSILVKDKKNCIKLLFQSMLLKDPPARVDCLTDKAAAPVAFWNDETTMDTPRPNGQITFDSDHQHYIHPATINTIVKADLVGLIAKVTEHENMGGQVLLWARTGTTLNYIKNLTDFRGVEAPGALLNAPNPAYQQSGLVQALVNSKIKLGFGINMVGTYLDAIVVETPDIPANYILCTMYTGDDSVYAPLAWRSHPQFKGLMLYNANENNPIIGRDAQLRRYLGLGVWNRDAGAVMYTAHATVWTEPTFV